MDSPIKKAGILVLMLMVLIATAHRLWSESQSDAADRDEGAAPTESIDRNTERETIAAGPSATPAHSESSESSAVVVDACATVEAGLNSQDDDEVLSELRQVSDRLAVADSPELLLAAALRRFGDDSSERKILLERAYALDPKNPLIAWNRLLSCADRADSVCDFNIIRDHAIELVADMGMNPGGLASIVRLQSQHTERFTQYVNDSDATNLMANDEQVLRSFVENLSVYGEIGAVARLRKEAARLKATPGYDQCNFAGNPYGL